MGAVRAVRGLLVAVEAKVERPLGVKRHDRNAMENQVVGREVVAVTCAGLECSSEMTRSFDKDWTNVAKDKNFRKRERDRNVYNVIK